MLTRHENALIKNRKKQLARTLRTAGNQGYTGILQNHHAMEKIIGNDRFSQTSEHNVSLLGVSTVLRLWAITRSYLQTVLNEALNCPESVLIADSFIMAYIHHRWQAAYDPLHFNVSKSAG